MIKVISMALWCSALSAVLVFTLGAAALGVSDGQYRIFMDETEIISDAAPFKEGSRVMVPLGALARATGAAIDWDNVSKTAAVHRGTDRLELTIGSDIALYNGMEIPMDTAPVLNGGRTFLPLRFVSEWLGLQVNSKGKDIRMHKLAPLEGIDTMEAPRGNTNGNLNNLHHAILYKNELYGFGRLHQEGVPIYEAPKLMLSDLDLSYFNIWEDRIYAGIQELTEDYSTEHFVRLDAQGNILETVEKNVGYCQIHDGWLYFLRYSDGQLCRRLLAGGDVQPLGVFGLIRGTAPFLEIVITDQHIITNDGRVILSMNHDGTARRRLLLAHNEPWPGSNDYGVAWFEGLEYSDGLLYLNVGGRSETARICRLKLDGTGLQAITGDGATEINIAGDWLYYTKLTEHRTSLDSPSVLYVPSDIARVKIDDSGREILAEGDDFLHSYHSPTVMPDGSVYYAHFWEGGGEFEWIKVQ